MSANFFNWTKAASPQQGQPGDIITWTMTLPNIGDSDSPSLEISDLLPHGLTFIPGSAAVTSGTGSVSEGTYTPPPATGGTSTVNLTYNGSVPAGGSATITFQTYVNPGVMAIPPDGQDVTNTASVTSDYPGSQDVQSATPAPNDSRVVHLLGPDFTTSDKTSQPTGPVAPGGTIHYRLILNNTSSNGSGGIQLNENLPSQYLSSWSNLVVTNSAGGTIQNVNTSQFPGSLTILPNIVAGQPSQIPGNSTTYVDFDVTVPDDMPLGTCPGNQFILTFPQSLTPMPQEPVTNCIQPTQFDNEKTTVDPAPGLNSVGDYTITSHNTGDVDAPFYHATDTLGTGQTLVAGSATATIDGQTVPVTVTGTSSAPTFEINQTVPAGSTVTISYQAQNSAPIGTDVTNTVNITTYPNEPDDPNPPKVTVTISDPILSGVKTVNPATVEPGQKAIYTITCKNNGNKPTNPFTLTDSLPPGLTLVPGVAPTVTIDGASSSATQSGTAATPVFTVTDPVNPNSTIVVSFPVTVDPSLETPKTLTNNAGVTGRPHQPVTPIPPVDLQVVAPKWQASKQPSVTTVHPGDPITWTVNAKNTGSGAADQFVLNEQLPPGVTLTDKTQVTATQNGAPVPVATTGSPTAPIFTVPGPINPGNQIVLTFPTVVDPSVAVGTTLTNHATISPPTPNQPATPVPPSNVDVIGTPLLNGVKHPSATTANPGDTITWTVPVTNNGNGTATGLILTDSLPQGLTLNPATATATLNGKTVPVTQGGTNTVPTFTVAGPINPQDTVVISFTTTVGADVTPGSTLQNKASIKPDTTTPPTDIPAPPINIVVPKFPSPLKAASVATTNPGDTFTYTVTAQNTGTGTAKPLTITDPLPLGLTYTNGATATLNGQSTPVSVTGPATNPTFSLPGPVAPGDNISLSFNVLVAQNVAPGTIFTNIATLHAYPGDPGTPTPPVDVEVGIPKFDVSKNPSASFITPGGNLIYTISAQNTGNAPVPQFILTDTLPANATFHMDSPVNALVNGQNTPVTVGGTPASPTFTLPGPINPGDNIQLSFPVLVDPATLGGTLLQNSATLDPGIIPPIPIPSPPVTVGIPDLSDATKSADTAITEPGASYHYTVFGTNTGTAPAYPLTITDTLPSYITYDTSQPPLALINGQQVTATYTGTPTVPAFAFSQPVNPGDSFSLTFQVLTDPNAPHAITLTNDAVVSAYPGDPGFTTNTVDVYIPPTLTKTVDSETAVRCGTLTYTLHYINYPDSDTLNIYDYLPEWVYFSEENLIQITIGNNPPFYINNEGNEDLIDFTLDRHIPALTEITIQFTVKIDACAPYGCVLSNQAYATTNLNQAVSNVVESVVICQDKTEGKHSGKTVVKSGGILPLKLSYNEGDTICKTRNLASFLIQECGTYKVTFRATAHPQQTPYFASLGFCIGNKPLQGAKTTEKVDPSGTKTLSLAVNLNLSAAPVQISLTNLSKLSVYYSTISVTVLKLEE